MVTFLRGMLLANLISTSMMKQFLKGGEAESYKGITIVWSRGADPVLEVFENGKKREEIPLSVLDNLEALRALMAEIGFHKKQGGTPGKPQGQAADAQSAQKVLAKRATKGGVQVEAKTGGPVAKGGGVERIENPKATSEGEVVQKGVSETGTVPAFGEATTCAVTTGVVVLYYVANKRKKNARSVQ